MTYAVALDGRYISINWCIKYKSVLHCLCQDASARAPLPVTVHQLGGTMWNDVRVCYLPPRERERAVSLFRWHTFATNRLLSRTSRPFLSLSLSPFNSHPERTLRRGSRVDFFFQPVCHYIYGPAGLESFPPTINIYIYDFNDTSIAVGRLQLFSPSHCHRALLYPSDETLLTNSPVGE